MSKGSQDLRDVIAIHPLVLTVIFLGAIDLGLSSLIPPAMTNSSFLAQAAGTVNTSALDMQCTGAYDYTCQYPAMGEEGRQCGAGREVQSSQVKGYCIQFQKAHADQVLTSTGQWMSPEQAASLPPNIGSQVSGGFVSPDSANFVPTTDQSLDTGATQAGQGALPSTPVTPQNVPASFPNGTQFSSAETTAAPDTFGAQASGLDTSESPFSTQSAQPSSLNTASNYNVTNASGVCNGCFAPGQVPASSPAASPVDTSAAQTSDYSNYSDFRASTNVEDDRANSAYLTAYQSNANSFSAIPGMGPSDYSDFYNDFPTFQTDTNTVNYNDFYNSVGGYQQPSAAPNSGNWFTNTWTSVKNFF